MNETLQKYLDSHDYAAITEDCVRWIRSWFDENGKNSPAVIGISGGKDSSIVAALCVQALGKDRVCGLLMPNGTQSDISVSRNLVEYLGIEHHEINIAPAYNAIASSVTETGLSLSAQSRINLGPRVRMCTLYAVSQSMNGRVSNNCNRSERYVGYSTIFGDAAGDFSPLANLTVSELQLVGTALGLPKEFVYKAPSDGLTGHTDEDNFGFTYEQLDTYILTSVCEDDHVRERIDRLHRSNLFKLKPIASFVPDHL